jgi:hypothetical protein
MPKAGEYKWLSSMRVLVYNASVYPKSDIYTIKQLLNEVEKDMRNH